MYVYALVTVLVDSGREKVASSCKSGDEPSGSIKYGEFLDWLRTG